MKKIKYINNDPDLGIAVDWNFLKKELRKLVAPYVGDNYVPDPPCDDAVWFLDLSERSVGKTTNYLLLGMLAFKYYGINIELLRVKKEMIRPINIKSLFDVIQMPEFHYVERLTDGKYNGIYYQAKNFYYARFENGKVNKEEISPIPFCHLESMDNVNLIKSSYNNPHASFVIVDEFINASGINRESDFLNLCQVLATYRRNRLDMRIFMLANTINPYNQFFQELCVDEPMRKLHLGESKIVSSPLGTKVWIHLVKFDERVTEKRRVNNLFYFGFMNPKLASINGGTEWAIKNYPHLPRIDIYEEEKRTLLLHDVYFRHYGKMMCAELWHSTKIGTYLYVREQTQTPKNPMRIYTLDPCSHYLERYGLGEGDPLDKRIYWHYANKRIFYSYNNIGNLFEDYIQNIKKR